MLENKGIYMHDFDGSCAPVKGGVEWGTFSVGIFQWIPKSSGKGLKRSAVKYRIRGRVSNAGSVYSRARTVCKKFDDGWFPKSKSEVVGTI